MNCFFLYLSLDLYNIPVTVLTILEISNLYLKFKVWVKICFVKVNPPDHRRSFLEIKNYGVFRWKVPSEVTSRIIQTWVVIQRYHRSLNIQRYHRSLNILRYHRSLKHTKLSQIPKHTKVSQIPKHIFISVYSLWWERSTKIWFLRINILN